MDIREIAVAAIEELVAWHTVGIIGDAGPGHGSGIGTGTAASWRGLNLILTASHVVERSDPYNLEFLFRPPGNIERTSTDQPGSALTDGLVFAQKVKILGVRVSTADDLAALPVSSEIAALHNVGFYALDSRDAVPSNRTRVVFTGFPAALGERVARSGLVVAHRNIAHQTVVGQPSFDDFDPKRNFACDYTFGDGPVEPMGISGAGVWFDRGSDELVWRAKLGFAGVLTAYHRKRGIVEGIRAEVVRDFLDSLL